MAHADRERRLVGQLEDLLERTGHGRPDEHREPCADRVCRRHLPADGQQVQAHRAGSDVVMGARQMMCRLDCHRVEQPVHPELRDPETENHHRGADPTREHGPGRGEDECADQCDSTHGRKLAARPGVVGHGAGHDRARSEGSARGHCNNLGQVPASGVGVPGQTFL